MNQFPSFVEENDVDLLSMRSPKDVMEFPLLDDFENADTFRGRSYAEIDKSMRRMWNVDALKALKLTFYLRTVTRTINIKGIPTEIVQSGRGAKDEFRKRMLWILYNHRKVFYTNAWLIPIVGSYRDLWELMSMDYSTFDEMNRNLIYSDMLHDLAEESTKDLFLKYLPLTKSNSKLTTSRSRAINLFASEFKEFVGLSSKDIRLMKSGGTAHNWQKLISTGKFKDIVWGEIPGKALTKLVNSKFISKHNLEVSFTEWLDSQDKSLFEEYQVESTSMEAQTNQTVQEEMDLALRQEIFTHLKLS